MNAEPAVNELINLVKRGRHIGCPRFLVCTRVRVGIYVNFTYFYFRVLSFSGPPTRIGRIIPLHTPRVDFDLVNNFWHILILAFCILIGILSEKNSTQMRYCLLPFNELSFIHVNVFAGSHMTFGIIDVNCYINRVMYLCLSHNRICDMDTD